MVLVVLVEMRFANEVLSSLCNPCVLYGSVSTYRSYSPARFLDFDGWRVPFCLVCDCDHSGFSSSTGWVLIASFFGMLVNFKM